MDMAFDPKDRKVADTQPRYDDRLTHAKLPNCQDRDGLGVVLEACRGYLLAVARRQIDPDLRQKAGASDLVQETLLEAQRDYSSFRGQSEADFLAWLRRLLLHNLSNFRRRYRNTVKRAVSREVAIEPATMTHCVHSEDPLSSAEANDQIRLLRELMTQLAPDHQRVLSLWYEERSFEEIGRDMNRSTDAARMLWIRAIEKLRTLTETPERRKPAIPHGRDRCAQTRRPGD